jgi:hypothetical protein
MLSPVIPTARVHDYLAINGLLFEPDSGPLISGAQSLLAPLRNRICCCGFTPVSISTEENQMTLKYAISAVLLLCGTASALADTYYVVQDQKTMKCTVVKEKPKEDTLIGINLLGLEFKTQVEAEQAVKTTKVCVTK